MLTRRDSLRLSALAVLGLASACTLAACTDQSGPAADPVGSTQLGLVSSDLARTPGDVGAIDGVVAAMQDFGGRVYGALASTDGNLAVSPYSIAVALGMTLNGAGGKTAEEMRDVLGVSRGSTGLAEFNGGVNALTQAIEGLAAPVTREDGSEAELAIASANALFGEVTSPWSKPFLDELARDYGAGMRTVDLIRATEAARVAINAWTAKQTHDRIPEIIPTGVLTSEARLVLVNALYFKAPWEKPFQKGSTRQGPFYLEGGEPTMVDMMQGTGAGIRRGDGWLAVRLAYAGSALAMTVILPDAGSSLSALEASVSAGGLGALLGAVDEQPVQVGLPKWTFRADCPLTGVLPGLGMPTAFDPDRADFLAMTDDDDRLSIGAVLHQVFIAVDEDGTEAAAATAVVMIDRGMAEIGERVVVDRPFLFVIHDVVHGTPLFLGRVADPTAG